MGQNRNAWSDPTSSVTVERCKSDFRKKIQALWLLANLRVLTNLLDQPKAGVP